MSLLALYETIDHCVRSATVKNAEAMVHIPLVKPTELDDEGRLPGSEEFLWRVYKRQWVRDGIALYREVWPG